MTLLRIVIPLHLFCLSMISGQTRTAFIPRENRYPLFRIMLRGRFPPKKEARPKRPGNTLRVAAQYIQKTPKNNGLFGIWLADFGYGAAQLPLSGSGQILAKPRQMGFDGLIALARSPNSGTIINLRPSICSQVDRRRNGDMVVSVPGSADALSGVSRVHNCRGFGPVSDQNFKPELARAWNPAAATARLMTACPTMS